MKFIHTADWHLGKLFYGEYLTEEQEWILKNQFLPLIDEEKPDVILLAGDVYDRSVPPAEAVELFDEMVSEITGKRKIPFIVISGNHDSAERLSFASRILRGTGLFLCGDLYHTLAPVILKDDDGEVAFALFPMRNRGRCGKRFPPMSILMRKRNGCFQISFYGRWDMRQGKLPLPMNLWRAALRVTRSGLFNRGDGSYQRGCICAVQLYGTGTSPRAAESRGKGKCPLQRKSFEIFFQRSYPEKRSHCRRNKRSRAGEDHIHFSFHPVMTCMS